MLDASDDEYSVYDFSEFTQEDLLQIDTHVASQSQGVPKPIKLESQIPDFDATPPVSSPFSDASGQVLTSGRPRESRDMSCSSSGESWHTVKTEPASQIQLKRASRWLDVSSASSQSTGASRSTIKSENPESVKRMRAMTPTSTPPLQEFFSSQPRFEYDSSQPSCDEFNRLAKSLRWNKSETVAKKRSFENALVKEFNHIYGTDEDDIESWHMLCRVVGIKPLPDTMEACREAIHGTHVNLVDLVDIPNIGGTIKRFDSEKALSRYTRSREKYFPRKNAYTSGLLKYLLRSILNPSETRMPRRPRRN